MIASTCSPKNKQVSLCMCVCVFDIQRGSPFNLKPAITYYMFKIHSARNSTYT